MDRVRDYGERCGSLDKHIPIVTWLAEYDFL